MTQDGGCRSAGGSREDCKLLGMGFTRSPHIAGGSRQLVRSGLIPSANAVWSLESNGRQRRTRDPSENRLQMEVDLTDLEWTQPRTFTFTPSPRPSQAARQRTNSNSHVQNFARPQLRVNLVRSRLEVTEECRSPRWILRRLLEGAEGVRLRIRERCVGWRRPQRFLHLLVSYAHIVSVPHRQADASSLPRSPPAIYTRAALQGPLH